VKALIIGVLATLLLPAAAWGHATLIRTVPANGGKLAHSPATVRIVFDDVVQRGPGIEAVRNGGASVLDGQPRIDGGRTLVLPLRRGLAKGDYTVRWAIVSDDGHLESGVLAFAVGLGSAKPVPSLGAEATGARPPDVIARWLFLAGVLGSVGIAAFALSTGARDEQIALVLASSAVVSALGAADEAHRVGLSTRAGTALVVGSAYAVVVALVAAAATLESRALPAALVLALPLVAVPTTSGHALDRGLSRLNVAADLLHVAGAAMWVGALLGLVVTRRREVRLVLGGVALLSVTGVVRASYELLHVSQAWDTGYGRTLLVKTGLLLAAAAIGLWRRPRVELLLVAVLVGAVAVLVLQRPGRNEAAATAPAPVASGQPAPEPPAPPAGAIVVARELGPYGVALASERTRLTVLVLSPAGGGADGLDVQIGGHDATTCGHGCYRTEERHGLTTSVVVDGMGRVFRSPRGPHDASRTTVTSFRQFFRRSKTVEYVERLASSRTNVIVSRWRLEAPNRVGYTIRGGSQAIIIGAHRWDRASPHARWVESRQAPLSQPVAPFRKATNVWQISTHDIVFYDPTIPAYFDLEFHERPTALHMIAAAHFMTDRYLSFGSAPRLRAPR
jgi:copper transport protein